GSLRERRAVAARGARALLRPARLRALGAVALAAPDRFPLALRAGLLRLPGGEAPGGVAAATPRGLVSAMDLLLTHGYFLAEDAQERRIMKPYPPLGLLYLSSHLK